MEGNHSHHDGAINAGISVLCTIFAWISVKDAQTIAAFISSCIAIVSGVMAIRYYYHATKKLK